MIEKERKLNAEGLEDLNGLRIAMKEWIKLEIKNECINLFFVMFYLKNLEEGCGVGQW